MLLAAKAANLMLDILMTKFTKEQALTITGFTGVSACNFGDFQEDVQKRMGMSVWTHQFADKAFADKVKELYRKDFIEMCL